MCRHVRIRVVVVPEVHSTPTFLLYILRYVRHADDSSCRTWRKGNAKDLKDMHAGIEAMQQHREEYELPSYSENGETVARPKPTFDEMVAYFKQQVSRRR